MVDRGARYDPLHGRPFAERRSRRLSFHPPTGRGGPQFIPRPDSARIGKPAPWATLPTDRRSPTIDDLVSLVDPIPADTSFELSVSGRPPSAVLIPLSFGPHGPEMLLTRRAWHLRSHTGEVSFPGGRMDREDGDLATTALRETEEEIGLARDLVEIVGVLDQHITVSSPAPILPYVGLVDGRPDVAPSPDEVDGVLHVPIAELLDPSIYREEIWVRDGQELEITFFELEGDTLWGATARMVRSLFERLI